MIVAWIFLIVCLSLMSAGITIFIKRNGRHTQYPMWQFVGLYFGIIVSGYAALFCGLYIILSV